MKKFFLTIGVVSGLAMLSYAFTYDTRIEEGSKVKICHVPPGNPDNPQTLELSEQGAHNHLENHCLDYCGPCECD